MQIIIGIFLAILSSFTYAGVIDWAIARTSFPSDQSIGDTGQEKTPNGYVDLMSGNLVYDVPEVTLKGDRGLNFTLSRSYGKVNNGFRSMGNWELESPRLVMMTGPSTILQGDNGAGICEANGDATNNSSGRPSYTASLTNSSFRNKIEQTYINQVNVALANQTLSTIINLVQYFGSLTGDSNAQYNKQQAQNAASNLQFQLFNAYQNNINALTVSSSQAATEKAKYKQSIMNVLQTGQVTVLVNGTRLTTGNISSVLDSLAVNSSFTVQTNNALMDSVIRQVIIGYLYYHNIEKIRSPSLLNDITQTSTLNTSSNVDSRQRPISLYLPGQKNITFYPIKSGVSGYPQSAKYISQDNWYISCSNSGKDFIVRSNNGVSYHFPSENRENQTGFTSFFGSEYIPGRVSIYASKIENQFNEGYVLNYFNKKTSTLIYNNFNYTNKFFLKSVQHTLDGKVVNESTPELVLNYVKSRDGNENADESQFDNISGDITLKRILRYINGGYKEWSAYNYTSQKILANYKLSDALPTGGTIGSFQDNNSASIYLQTAGYITGDAVSYNYGGPYRIAGSATPAASSMTAQDFLWFYSDLTGINYYKGSSNGLINTKSVNWTYTLINESRPGFVESKSYKITTSNYTGSDVNPLQITYAYSRNKDANEQNTSVTVKDSTTGLSKVYNYVMSAYEGGSAENFKHGLLKKISIDSREEIYNWITLNLIGQKPKTINDNYSDNEDVFLVRLSNKTINHNGAYGTTYKDFDQYGNAQTIESTGLNGTNPISLPSMRMAYFNADPTNSAVDDGSLPWITGLPRQKTSGTYIIQSIDYDPQGAINTENKEGQITKFKYETVSFSACLGNLSDFAWSKFASCFSNYIVGDKHIGLPMEVDIGNGKQITQYSAYKKGIPTNVRLANGGQETNGVDDFGNIVFHTDADGISSQNKYDDAGRIKVETPIIGLSYTTIDYNGLNIVRTMQNGGNYSKTEKYNGDGLLIYSSENTSNKTVINSSQYDAFGNVIFSSNPSASGTDIGIRTSYDVFDRPKTVIDNGVTINYCYQSCGGRTGAVAFTTDAYGVTETDYLAAGDFSSSIKTKMSRKGNDGSVFETFIDYDLALLKPITAISGASTQRYTYNSNGSLATEKDNSINGQKNYGYDATGKINTITHQDGSVETIEYYPINDLIASRNWRGVTTSYGYTAAGRLISTSNANTAQSYGRDSLGRVISLTQSINSHDANYAFTLRFGYNNLNQIVSINYPNGKAVDLSNQNAFGEIGSIPNVIQSLNYNALHQLIFVQANTDVAWDYSYSNNGLPTGVSSTSLNKCAVSISYGYDALNRINRMVDNCGATYNASIDRYGTGLMKQIEQDHARYQYSYNNDDINTVNVTAKSQLVAPASYVYQYVNGTSRLGSVSGSPYQFSYDGMGNVTNDGIRALDYDAYYRISKNGNESYIYNADGLRVRAVRENGITDYIYDLAGRLIYEINHRAGYSQAYVYVGDKLVATLENYPDANDGYDFINNFEAAEFGLLSLLDSYLDSDDDGLPDYLERFIGSDPNNPDTDGDGYKDGYEYKQLGAKGVLDAGIHPSEPDPDEDMAAWLPTVLDLILEDD
ncbi:RHS repeat protein [Acinetobacter nosocomialis]|uniref:RHS repeat protein n=1 Tax=Acinetobacter nosocomialis TaxID=106654 RepID=UPI00244A37F5|nr:RHS repeat protein [Acinetobacter nosocomialis]MDH2636489.1 RHS repeat protein [Acinetobacter nosocomialis]